MKKLRLLSLLLMTAIICTMVSCHKDDTKEPDTKYLSADSFAASKWKGNDTNGEVNLIVSSKTDMTLTYYVLTSISKNTDPQPVLQTVKISYTFNEAEGTFSGTGDDSNKYSGNLTSNTNLKFTGLKTGPLDLTKEE